jgi:hypothetical protein
LFALIVPKPRDNELIVFHDHLLAGLSFPFDPTMPNFILQKSSAHTSLFYEAGVVMYTSFHGVEPDVGM